MAAFSIAPTLGPGSRLGQYEIIAPLRAGGMATLFLGRRVGPAGFARHVAIKVVHSHLASDPSFVEMFLDEARLAACIQHPNVVHTEELGEANGMYYLAMEYVHGCSLAQFIVRLIQQKRGLAPEVAAHIAMKLADGLHAAHEVKDEHGRPLGVVHRDISPQNVLLAYNGQVKLIDFGVAKALGRSRETTGASLKGKIRYMSPEQAWGRGVDRRTDVYALGIVLWETLTHRRLFVADDDFAALERVRNPRVPPPSTQAPWVSSGLDHAVLTALAADPEARFQTAQAFRRALGGACPKAVMVEPDDLGALLVSVMEDDIERERRSAPPAVTRALEIKPPEPARRTGAMQAFTREMPAYAPGDDAMTAAEVPSARGHAAPAPIYPPTEASRIRPSDPSAAHASLPPTAAHASVPPMSAPHASVPPMSAPHASTPSSGGPYASAPSSSGPYASTPSISGPYASAPSISGPHASAASTSAPHANVAPMPATSFQTGSGPIVLPTHRTGARIATVAVLLVLLLVGALGAWLAAGRWLTPTAPAVDVAAQPATPSPLPSPPVAPPSAPIVAPEPVATPAPEAPPSTAPAHVRPTSGSTATRERETRSTTTTPPRPAPAPSPEAPSHPHLPSSIARPAPIAPAPIAPVAPAPAPTRAPIAPVTPTPQPAPHHAPDGPYLQEPTF